MNDDMNNDWLVMVSVFAEAQADGKVFTEAVQLMADDYESEAIRTLAEDEARYRLARRVPEGTAIKVFAVDYFISQDDD